jgi:parallel beta-helix repeat protein
MLGSGSARNNIRHNHVSGNLNYGINITGSGLDNLVIENVISSNALGISNGTTNGTRIEGNVCYQNLGRLAPSQALGLGINIAGATGLTVKNNSSFLSSGFDFYWDNSGNNTFIDNAGLKSMSALKLTNTTAAARNPGFLVGDSFLLEVSGAPANAPVYLRLIKDMKDLGTTGPYGGSTDAQGRWSTAGTYDSSAIGTWYVQALFGSPESSYQSGVIRVTVSKPTS